MSAQRVVTEHVEITHLSPVETAETVAARMNGVSAGLKPHEYMASFQLVPIETSGGSGEGYGLLLVCLIDVGSSR